ncbi:MAG: VOC family protein, partial [Acidimicrobiia bacterium]
DHHPDVDLRYPGAVHISLLTHARGGLTELDARLAAALSAAAAEAGLRSEPTTAIRLALTHPSNEAAAFWTALLAYRELRPADGDGPLRLVDARRISPPLVLEPDHTEGRPPRLAVQLDVAADVAADRVAAAVAAGGRLVEQRPEEGTWLLADPTGVEIELSAPPP